MVMMKVNKIDNYEILDTNSLFEYFSKQNIFDIYYTELLKHNTSTSGAFNINIIGTFNNNNNINTL